MTDSTEHNLPTPEVVEYYAKFPEEARLDSGASRLEFERTREILAGVLPQAPARVIDVGGAAGAYSLWLAEQGYEAHLVDASARLLEVARKRSGQGARQIASLSAADARSLPHADGFAAAVLGMGPPYHLVLATGRLSPLPEASRVLDRNGVVVVAAISRYASTLDGLARKLTLDPRFVTIRDRDLRDGQHRNETERVDYFTTSYFHRPDELRRELEAAAFQDVQVLGVEGPGWMLPDFDARWKDPALRRDLLDVARTLEREPTILGASAHLIGIGWKR